MSLKVIWGYITTGRLRKETGLYRISSARLARLYFCELGFIGSKSDIQSAKTTAATASAPNKIIEHVIQLEISPFSFVCRIIACILLSIAG
jgi:hypothetical protein